MCFYKKEGHDDIMAFNSLLKSIISNLQEQP